MDHMKRYWPEIIACLVLIGYTIVRTLVVAHGISPVSHVSWQIFLWIEIVTTVPYVWAMGVIIRQSATKAGDGRMKRRLWYAVIVAAVSLLAPYVYLACYGSLGTTQGIAVFVGLLVVFTLPSIVRSMAKFWRRP